MASVLPTWCFRKRVCSVAFCTFGFNRWGCVCVQVTVVSSNGSFCAAHHQVKYYRSAAVMIAVMKLKHSYNNSGNMLPQSPETDFACRPAHTVCM